MNIDPAYENLQLSWKPETIYDWNRHVWRVVLVSPWKVGLTPKAVNPDALLDEAAPFFATKNGGGKKTSTKDDLVAVLKENSPQTAYQIANRLTIPYETVRACIGRHRDTFEQAGKTRRRHILYRLQEGV